VTARIVRLLLTDFRSYGAAELVLGEGPAYLYGPNGAGKTNLLEAVSFLAPGRGLRGAAATEVGRREPGEAEGRPWAVAAVLADDEGETRLGTGQEPETSRRRVRIEGETVAPGRLSDLLRLVWLTPQQDRLFLEGASERRRFLDRLVFADRPGHAAAVSAYEKAIRERTRLLTEGPHDPEWLNALEAQAAEAGARLSQARAATLLALQAEIDARRDRPFPQAGLSLSEDWAAEGSEPRLREALLRGRARDAAAGRALSGPHRVDLDVILREKDRPAAEGSTGEQKALVLNLVLAQAARLARAPGSPPPVLLLDEVAAHLDPGRRAALFDEITALGLQTFLTGTDRSLFEGLYGRGQGIRVEGGVLTPD
jgi:DNA replication and repair protein RecF